jgi:alkylation response protein AidB-like acyl-CoA dehydrogenase
MVVLSSFGSPDAAAYRATLDEWFATNVPEVWRNDRRSLDEEAVVALRRDWDRTLYDAGWAGLTWPTRFGGRGAGPVEEYLFYEASARHHAPEGFGRVGRLLVGPTLLVHGTDEQRERFLPGILTGEQVWCQGFSEPGAGSDLAAVATRAARDGDRFVVSGQKTWTSFAKWAGWCVLLARTGPAEARHHNLTMLLVDMDQPGVTVRPIKQISGMSEFSETFFDEVVVPAENVLGGVDNGWRAAMTLLTSERGAVEGANKYVELLEDAQLLGHCLQGTDERAARFLTLVEALRWQVMRAIESQSAGDAHWFHKMSVLKLYWSELWQDMTAAGLGSGCAEHRDQWRFKYLSSRASTIYSGTSEIQRNIIAERVLGLPRSR